MAFGIRGRSVTQAPQSTSWLGESEMATNIRAFDWSTSPLGSLAAWPGSLRSAVAMCLHSRFQMAIYWGADLICIYNDAEREILGKLHPSALGMPARELLRDSWSVVGPQLRAVMDRGEATWAEDQPLMFDRWGVLETGYFTYSYSPVLDDADGVGGVLLVTQETTPRIHAERRLDLLRELATSSMDASSSREACRLAADALNGWSELEFVVIYLTSEDGKRVVCVARSGRSGLPRVRAPSVDLNGSDPIAGLFRDLAARPLQSMLVDPDLILADDAGRPHAGRLLAARISRGSTDPMDGFVLACVSDGFVSDASSRQFTEMIGITLGRSVAAGRAREEERARTQSLAMLERAKTALFSNTSHELRTPLTLILGPLEEVLHDQSVPGSTREQLSVAHRSASRMLKIVNGLLDFARIEAGERTGAFQPTDLAQLTSDVAAMFRSTAESAGLRLSVDCPPLDTPIDADREAWERIVSNLLSNALKFTPSGSILVQIRGESDDVVLTVTDTGIGIAAQDLGRIFSRFYRAADPRARSHEGTGLGLALVRQLVSIHGGSVSAESAPDRGTTVAVRIPISREDRTPIAPAENGPRPTVGATASLLAQEAHSWLESGDAARGAKSATTGAEDSILLVEDNHDMRDYLCRLLAPHYQVRVAGNGAEAYQTAVENPPALVISDVMMPKADGYRLLHDLRADPQTRDVPVILISARADPESTLEALRLGADDYVVKPFGARELLARVEASLDSTRTRSRDAEARGRAEERALARGKLQSLLNDLKAAQRRVTASGDAERRRIERNLHDGAQQHLVAIRLELGLVSERCELDPAGTRAELERLHRELDDALEELRELAHGLYPPLLATDGLRPALVVAARHAAIPVEVNIPDVPRLARATEDAVYFCCVEALQNAAKHAGAGARATLGLIVRHGALEFRVSDDGVGFDRDALGDSYGLTNLADRLAALGGETTISAIPSQGTTVAGRVPLA